MAAALSNFSFVRPAVAGMGKPASHEQIVQLQHEHNVGLVLSLGAAAPAAFFESTGVRNVAVPWPDGGVPAPADLVAAIDEAARCVDAGKAVVFHCGHGRGRTGTALASYLVLRTRRRGAECRRRRERASTKLTPSRCSGSRARACLRRRAVGGRRSPRRSRRAAGLD